MNPTILLDRKSNITSQAGSITVFAPTSASFSPYTKDDLNSESYDSILICNDIDIVKEIDKVKSGDDDDDLFKLLSMNFYSNREPPKAPCDRLAPPKSARADREYGVSNRKDPNASSKAKNKLKNTLHENFFDLEKLKKRESPSKQSSMQSDNVKQKPKSPKVPDIKGFAGADGFYFNPLKSSERSSNRKVEPVPKYYSSFLLNKDSSNRDLSNGSRLTNSDVRYISLTRSKDFKETSTALRKNKGKDLTINIKQNRPLTTENKSISPRLQVDIMSSRTSDPNRFKSSLREQIINTFSNPLDSSRKNPYLGSPRKNEPSPASSSLVGWRNSFYSNLDSKRMTIEQISCAASIRGSAKKRESEAKKSKASLKTDTSSKGSVSTKREPLKNISEEFSKQRTTTNTQMSERCASPYLFFEMPNQSQNPSFHIAEGNSKEKTKTTTKRIKYSVDDKKGNTSSSKNKKDDSQPKFYFNKEKNGAKNGKGREHDSSYRDSFLSVRV